ncbi:MAG: adenylyl-sulfate kinase [Nitrososphaerota archaeon]|nr:adenylyl-sulfate kinase [Nitrososphaerota archaeon]MDG7028363.1 adenylyl-sulfate kinase [Nitrososphaerota archaeon]
MVGVVALISPYRQSRAEAKEIAGADRFVEVYVRAPLPVARRGTPRGSTPGRGGAR